MRKLPFILILPVFGLFACVHEGSQTASVAYSGSSFNPAWPSDSARNLTGNTATGPTGLTKSTDTIPRPFAIPNPSDTSQKKSLNPPH
jgi:hypothetical protein